VFVIVYALISQGFPVWYGTCHVMALSPSELYRRGRVLARPVATHPTSLLLCLFLFSATNTLDYSLVFRSTVPHQPLFATALRVGLVHSSWHAAPLPIATASGVEAEEYDSMG